MLKPPQRWAVVAAWLGVIGGLAPVAWRVHMLAWGAGWDLAPEFRSDPRLVAYVLALVAVEAVAALLTLGLIQPWGEVWPRWVPGLGGRRIPPRLVVVIASVGAVLVTVILVATFWSLGTMTLQGRSNPITQVHGGYQVFMLAHYLLWPLWPIGLWVAIVGFARRHLGWFTRASNASPSAA